MTLQGEHGLRFDLSIDGYQFPEILYGDDANWLMVRGEVRHPHGDWTFRDPCLETSDLERLADWFDGIATGRSEAEEDFLEPNLSFEYDSSPATISVTFSHESVPAWSGDDGRFEGVKVIFPLALNDPLEAARNLRDWLARFPRLSRIFAKPSRNIWLSWMISRPEYAAPIFYCLRPLTTDH